MILIKFIATYIVLFMIYMFSKIVYTSIRDIFRLIRVLRKHKEKLLNKLRTKKSKP